MSDDAQKVTEALRDLVAVAICRDACMNYDYEVAGGCSDCREGPTLAVLAALDLPARDAKARAEAVKPFEALADDWEATAGPIREQHTPVERLYQGHADDLRAALASAGPVEPPPAAEQAPDLTCPATHGEQSCIKPRYLARSGEVWDHGGGHFYASAEGARRLRDGDYDAADVLRNLRRVDAGEPQPEVGEPRG